MTKPRTLLATLMVAFLLAPALAAAQPTTITQSAEPQKRHGIYFDPVGIAFGYFGLGYEHVLGRNLSLQLGASYINPWDNDEIWAVGGELRVFVFPLGRAPGGLYLAPLLRAAYARGESERDVGGSAHTITGTGLGWGAGATIGWSWILGPLAMRAGIGGLYQNIQAEAHDGNERVTLGVKGPALTADLALGFVF